MSTKTNETSLVEVVTIVGKKTQELLKKHKEVIEENNFLQEQLNKKRTLLSEKENNLKSLQKENVALKTALGSNGNEEYVNFSKKQITRLVRDIDNCIKMLDSLE